MANVHGHSGNSYRNEVHRGEAVLKGKIEAPFEYSHTQNSERFYKATIRVKRENQYEDVLPVVARETTLAFMDEYEGANEKGVYLKIKGELRGYYAHDGNDKQKSRLETFVYATGIDMPEGIINICEDDVTNYMMQTGGICHISSLRRTNRGTSVADMVLAVKRGHGRKTFIPCTAYGQIAEYITENYEKGMFVKVEGELQERANRKGKYELIIKDTAVEECEQADTTVTNPVKKNIIENNEKTDDGDTPEPSGDINP